MTESQRPELQREPRSLRGMGVDLELERKERRFGFFEEMEFLGETVAGGKVDLMEGGEEEAAAAAALAIVDMMELRR